MNNNFWQEAAKQKHDMTIGDLLEAKRLKLLAERAAYESPLVLGVDNPYGPSGIYDERAIPNPFNPRISKSEVLR